MPKLAMWGKALTAMPRISKADWDGLDLVSRWLIATRGAVIVMTFTSAAFAGALAYKAGAFDGLLFALVTVGLCLAHATNNLINDLTDHWKGVDQGNYFRTQYGPQTVEDGFLTVGQLIGYAALTGMVALAIGIYLVFVSDRGEITLMLLGSGAFFVLFYTFPLKAIGLGEPAVLVVWGPLMVGGSYFVMTGVWSNEVALASLAYALGPTAVLFGKHTDKMSFDRDKGIRTLPVLLGESLSRRVIVGLLLAQYPVIVYLVYTGFFHPVMLVAFASLFSLKRVFQVFSHPRPDAPPRDFPEGVWPLWFVAAAFWFTRRYGGFFLVGLVLDLVLTRI
ncbi:MAG: prenyltransferase [bacterium]|nr:prenyltransferase [Deltaproteobacteria bacterium]MCP4908889.1 prenyltransferase [bacterium]